jgi:hypothetical protein
MLFKKFFIKHKTRKAVKKSTVSRENISFKKAKSIGIIYSWEGKRKAEIINDFANELEIAGKKVRIICFSRVDLKIIPVNIDFFNEHDFYFFGNIKSNKLKEFASLRFDFLYHLDTMQNLYIENILALTESRCRVSRADHTKKHLYDFMIQTKGSTGIETLCHEILHYTKALVNDEQ